MRVLICGSRNWLDSRPIYEDLRDLESVEIVIHGGARGADMLADRMAQTLGLPVKCYPADWDLYGRRAGLVRNQRMIDEGKPDIVLVYWDGKSRGTRDMIRRARRAGIEVVVNRET